MELYTTSKPDMQEAFPKKKVWHRKWSRFQRGIQRNFCYKNKKDDKVAVMHRDPISRPDLQKLRGSRRLQNKVFVDYMWYFCNRGREILRELKISVFPLVRMLMADKMCIWQGIMRSKTIEMTKTIVKEGECTNWKTVFFVVIDLFCPIFISWIRILLCFCRDQVKKINRRMIKCCRKILFGTK